MCDKDDFLVASFATNIFYGSLPQSRKCLKGVGTVVLWAESRQAMAWQIYAKTWRNIDQTAQ